MELTTASLEGQHVRLEPVKPHMREGVRAALDCDPEAWAIQLASGCGDGFPGYWAAMLTPSPPESRIGFAVRLLSSCRHPGRTSALNPLQTFGDRLLGARCSRSGQPGRHPESGRSFS